MDFDNNIQEKSSRKRRLSGIKKTMLAVGFCSSLSLGVTYLGNGFGVKDTVDEYVQDKVNLVSLYTSRDLGHKAELLQRMIENEENLDNYSEQFQNLIYSVNSRFNDESKYETIETLINDSSDEIKHDLLTELYSSSDTHARRTLRNQVFFEMYDNGRERVSGALNYLGTKLFVDSIFSFF